MQIGRGVVVITCRGCSPRRSANCSTSNAASACRHLASSSIQAASNCGPRRLSGSSAENACATAPLLHSTRRRDGIQVGRSMQPVRGKEAGDALDHHLAHLVLVLADQRDAPRGPVRIRPFAERRRAHPLRTGPRLAGAAAAENEPGAPRSAALRGVGRPLMPMRKLPPVVQPGEEFAAVKSRQDQLLLGRRQSHPCVEQVHDGIRRGLGGRHRHVRNLPATRRRPWCRRARQARARS